MTNRRHLLSLSLLMLGGTTQALAQAPAYPSRPITIVAPYSAGSTADMVARIIADRLRETLAQPVIIDNRVGAAGSIGTTLVARAPADGYTLLIATQSHTANPSLYAKLPWDPIKSFTPIVLVGVIPNVVAVSAASPYKTLADFVTYAKTRPDGQVNYASAGVGTSIHLTAEMLKNAAQIKLTHIPYKGDSESYAALRAGDVAMAPLGLAFAKSHVDSGELRALAVTTPKRSRLLPNVPTAAESGFPAFDVRPWYAFLAPAGTPPAVVAKLNAAITESMKAPAVQAKLLDLGLDLDPGTPEALEQFLKTDAARWEKVIKEAGIRLE